MIKLISVKLHTILTIKKILGQGKIDFSLPDGSTVEDLLSILVERWGELSSHLSEPEGEDMPPHIRVTRIMVNGRDIAFLNGRETVLKDGDEVLVLPIVSGG